jgi:hypothetical protein
MMGTYTIRWAPMLWDISVWSLGTRTAAITPVPGPLRLALPRRQARSRLGHCRLRVTVAGRGGAAAAAARRRRRPAGRCGRVPRPGGPAPAAGVSLRPAPRLLAVPRSRAAVAGPGPAAAGPARRAVRAELSGPVDSARGTVRVAVSAAKFET